MSVRPLFPTRSPPLRCDQVGLQRRGVVERAGAGVRISDLAELRDAISETLLSQMETWKHVSREKYPGRVGIVAWVHVIGSK